MKKKTLLILAVLITALACLFTSCSASVEPPKAEEEFGYVTFGNGGSRSLSTEYGIKSYDSLYWYYTATKKDSFGFTGQTSGQTTVPHKNADGTGIGSGTIRLSQGAWEFELFAYESARTGTESDNLVYQGKSEIIVLKGGETKAVPISVDLKGEYGVVNLSRAYFEWANNSAAEGEIYVTVKLAKDGSTPTTHFFGPLTSSNDKYTFATTTDTKTVPEGYYTCTVNAYMKEDVTAAESGKSVKTDATPLATQTLGLRVYGNATTYITGNLTEGIFAKVVFDVAEQDMKVFVPNTDGSASITGISVTPSGDTTKTTSVEFSKNALSGLADDATLQLDVKVTPVEAAFEKFQVSGTTADNKSAFAGIDITLIQTTANGQPVAVDSFNSNPDTTATVTTYIATGLSGVSVHYSSDNGTTEDFIIGTEAEFGSGSAKGYYESETGKLVFTTTHFSEYYVLANCVAFNSSRNVAYATLEKAIDYAQTGDIVKLMADYTIPQSTGTIKIEKGKNFTLDLNGYTLSAEKRNTDRHYYAIDNYGTLIIEDSSSDNTGTIEARGIENLENGVMVINSGKFYDVDKNGGAAVWNEANITINGGSFYADHIGNAGDNSGPGCLNNQGYALITAGTFESKNKRTYAIISTGEIDINPTAGKNITVNGSHGGLGVDSGSAVVRGGDFSSDDFYGLYVSNDGTGVDPETAFVTVYGGTFNGKKYSVWIGSDYNNPVNSTIEILGGVYEKPLNAQNCTREGAIVIKGGIFSADPSAYVSEGYCAIEGKDGNYTVQVAPVRIGEKWYASLNDAINAATDGAVITLGEGEFSTDEIQSSNAKGKTITFVGQDIDKTSLAIGSNVNQGVSGSNVFIGSNLTLKQMKIVADPNNGKYKGFQHVGSVSYESCKIVNQLTLYGATESFNDCVLEYKDHYPIWTWGSRNVTFTDCTFNTGGKAILLYGVADGTTGDSLKNPTTSLTVSNCIFNDDGTLNTDKAAIETGNDYNATYIINVNNVTVNGFAVNPEGTSTGSVIWGNKKSMDGNHLVVTIDGTQVYPKSN